uniref:Uncharacterized protein n=1 Tax=Nothobranchius furzeri TaxID=105023 RepID=A0A8C6M2E5_NOTFU
HTLLSFLNLDLLCSLRSQLLHLIPPFPRPFQMRTRLVFSLTVTHSRRLLPYPIYSVKCPCQFTPCVSSITLFLCSSIQPALPVDDPLLLPSSLFHCSFASFHLSFSLGLKPARKLLNTHTL